MVSKQEKMAIHKRIEEHQNANAVLADHVQRFSRPPRINGRIPDLYVVYDNHTTVEEIETGEIDKEQIKDIMIGCEDRENHNFYWFRSSSILDQS